MFDDSKWSEILNQYDDPLTVSNLAEILGITRKMVRKYFKRAGVSYKVLSKTFYVTKAVWIRHVKTVFAKVGTATPNDMARWMLKYNHLWEISVNPPLPEPTDEEQKRLDRLLNESRRDGFLIGREKGRSESKEEAIRNLREEGFTEKKIAAILNLSERDVRTVLSEDAGTLIRLA